MIPVCLLFGSCLLANSVGNWNGGLNSGIVLQKSHHIATTMKKFNQQSATYQNNFFN
jgi:hypothetical protein